MKKLNSKLILAVAALSVSQMSIAAEWRINNDPAKGADFISINAAMDNENVTDGDILYLDPGCLLNEAQTITKAVKVIGTGWEYTDRPYEPAVITGKLYIQAAATIVGAKIDGVVYPQSNDVVIERCFLGNGVNTTNGYDANNVSIISCYIAIEGICGQGGTSSSKTRYWKIFNNYIYSTNARGIQKLYQPEIRNNYMLNTNNSGKACIAEITGANVCYNIMLNKASTGITYMLNSQCFNCYVVNNCMSTNDTYSGNKCIGTTETTGIFVSDSFVLCENSQAANIDGAGNDAGVYGGLYPYVPNGMPKNVPYFTSLSVPTKPTDGRVKVSFKIENQNN